MNGLIQKKRKTRRRKRYACVYVIHIVVYTIVLKDLKQKKTCKEVEYKARVRIDECKKQSTHNAF